MSKNNHPSFVIVGHPNQGKSSIISALAYDDRVGISSIPGETKKAEKYSLIVDDEVIYELFDTPGFQRSRKILDWLNQIKAPQEEHLDTLKKFFNAEKFNDEFKDEIELLKPILDGGIILYVVDASKPYSKEYKAEMEILQWSGQTSMQPLLNHRTYFPCIKHKKELIAQTPWLEIIPLPFGHLPLPLDNSLRKYLT